jgi:hypothetical protein
MKSDCGHGWVWPSAVQARCGGPVLCSACAADLRAKLDDDRKKPELMPVTNALCRAIFDRPEADRGKDMFVTHETWALLRDEQRNIRMVPGNYDHVFGGEPIVMVCGARIREIRQEP